MDEFRVGFLPANYGSVTSIPVNVEGVEFGALHVGFSGGAPNRRQELAIADLVGAVVLPSVGDVIVSAICYRAQTSSCCGSGGADRVRSVVSVASFPSTEDGKARAERLATALICAAQGFDVLGPRPPRRRLLAFINPTSGPGKGVQIMRTICTPILEDAECDVTVIVTRNARHPVELLRDMPSSELLAYAGVLAGGGDGTLHLVLQGIMARADWATIASRVVLGSLPTGSGNAMAASICAAAGVPYSVTNGTLFIAKNSRTPLDITSVFVNAQHADGLGPGVTVPGWGERRYSFLSTAWGIIGDLDIESESLRCLGALRFDVMGLIRALALRKYQGRVWYLPHDEVAHPVATSVGVATGLTDGLHDASAEPLTQGTSSAPPAITLLRPFSESLPSPWKCIDGPFTLA